MKEILLAALKRSLWTALETALAMIPVGAAVEEVQWLHILSVVAVATLIAFLKSLLVSMPEVKLQSEVENLKTQSNDVADSKSDTSESLE